MWRMFVTFFCLKKNEIYIASFTSYVFASFKFLQYYTITAYMQKKKKKPKSNAHLR